MKQFKNVLVLLNFDESDLLTLKYATLISNLAQSDRFYFTHITESFDIPENILKIYPELSGTIEEHAVGKIQQFVRKNFKGADSLKIECIDVTCTHGSGYIVKEGIPLDELIKLNVEKDIDLVIFSYDQKNEESVDFAKRVIRKTYCSVLALCGKADGEYKDILVPVDFSEHSQDAVKLAIAFAKANRIKKINTINVYDVPPGFHKTGKSYEEFAEIMENNARKFFKDFIKSIDDTDVRIKDLYYLNKNPVKGIVQAVIDNGIDLIVINSRGRSPATSIFLGNITEKLISQTIIPILIARKKGESLSILNALMKI